MPETLGRGDPEDESRIEREAKYAHENPQGVSRPVTPISPAVAALNEQVLTATISTLTGGSSMSANSFAEQVALLQDLKNYLAQFQERLVGVSNSYRNKVDGLHNAGMMDETHRRYVENELAQTQSLIARLVEHIDANDIPKVESEISYLEQKL